MYIKHNSSYDTTSYSSQNISNKDIEMQVVSINKGKGGKIIVYNVYRPPTGDCSVFIEKLEDAISLTNGIRYVDRYILGDVNMDHKKTNNVHVSALINAMSHSGLKQIIKSCTRVTNDTKSLIDVIYTDSTKFTGFGIVHTNLSDHYKIMVYVNRSRIKKNKVNTTRFKGRSYRNYSFDRAHEYFQTVERSQLLQMTNVNMAWKYFRL